jgi:hypothetical protein
MMRGNTIAALVLSDGDRHMFRIAVGMSKKIKMINTVRKTYVHEQLKCHYNIRKI